MTSIWRMPNECHLFRSTSAVSLLTIGGNSLLAKYVYDMPTSFYEADSMNIN